MAALHELVQGNGPEQKVIAPPPQGIPPTLTNPHLSKGLKDLLSSFIGKLVTNGVPRDKVNKALTEMAPEMHKIAAATSHALSHSLAGYIERKEQEDLRRDYLGRALLFDLEPHLPLDRDTREKLAVEPVKGFVPIQVCEGLITALKGAHGLDTIKEFSAICMAKAEQCRSEVDYLIDVNKFITDPEVKKIVGDVTTRFRLLLHKKSEADQKKWISNQISTSHAFRMMKRDLTEEELGIIVKTILKK